MLSRGKELQRHSLIIVVSILILSIGILFTGCVAEELTEAPDLIYLTEDFPPFNYEEEGELKGIGVELLQEAYQEMGFPLSDENIRIGFFSEGYQLTLTTPGYAFFSAARTPEREDLFLWAGPIGSYEIVLFSRRGSDITIHTHHDLNQYLIGAVEDDVSVGELLRAGVDGSRIITDPDPVNLIWMLDSDEIDLFASGDVAGEYLIAKATGKHGYFNQVYQLADVELFYIFHRETPKHHVEMFQAAIQALKETPDEDGVTRYDHIFRRYIPSTGLAALTYMTEEYYPYNYQAAGQKMGISIEILEEVFSDRNTDLSRDHILFSTWEEGYKKTLSAPGYVLFSTARTPEREEQFLWAGPIIRSRNVLFMRSGAGEVMNGDILSLSIGVITDDVAAEDLLELGVWNITYATSAEELIHALDDGKIDAWAYAEYPGMNLIAQYALDPEAITIAYPLNTHEYFFAFNKETPLPLVQAFQQALDRIRSEKDTHGISRYERILYRYLTPEYADEVLTPEDAIALVSLTADAIGRDAPATIRAINTGIHPYQDADKPGLYVFAYNTDVIMVAHADNIHLVGESFKGKTDVAGKAFRDEIVAGALENGSGWVDYIYINPAESGLFWKSTYYQRATGSDGKDYVVCSGIFKTE
ncbi:MAG: ABC transporter substrate-binding protein [Methanocalculus sp. MSAO_Arc2]|uniref:transporter substrate-binding domain-containing protein n=1 Tax=Methanocalculus sp. MSAO_Arc2 TaxID=2293855 RepID=UPI000FEE25DC|nr:MAG: ABC transporter substrate-binding protein [Methanocalculus sp. MSAO_Arc2]